LYEEAENIINEFARVKVSQSIAYRLLFRSSQANGSWIFRTPEILQRTWRLQNEVHFSNNNSIGVSFSIEHIKPAVCVRKYGGMYYVPHGYNSTLMAFRDYYTS